MIIKRHASKARIDAPGALHHIIVRGIDRCAIFRDDHDCDKYSNDSNLSLPKLRPPVTPRL